MPTRYSILSTRWALPVMMAVLTVAFVVVPSMSGRAQQTPAVDPARSADGPDATGQDPQADPGPQTASDPESQAGDTPDQVQIFRSGINFIRVDTIVTDDDGNHVADLQINDFEVYEDGELQTVETFDLVEISAVPEPGARPPIRIATRADEEREAERSDVRVFVIFFDDYHVRFENGQRAALTITEFLRNNLRPADLVAVMYPLTPVMDLSLTRNHDVVIDQVENFYGRKYDYEPRNLFEERYAQYPPTVVERIRNDVSMSALNGLMIHLGGLREARKSVLLISEGYTNYLPPPMRGFRGLSNPASLDPNSAESNFEQTQQLFADTEILLRVRELYQTANRFNTSIYALDPRGLAVGEYDASNPNVGIETSQRMLRTTQDTLHILSEQTDGRAIVNRNNIAPGLQQMLKDSSAYYLLGYTSTQAPTDGRFHEIEVRVNRDDVNVRARNGYWAVTERDAARMMRASENEPPKAVDVALSALAQPRRGHAIRTWVGTSRGENGRTRVTFVWEPTSGPTGAGEPTRVLLTAMSDAGGPVFRGRIPERTASSSRGLAGAEASSDAVTMASFEADPGVMQINVAVEGEDGDVLDRDRDEIEVPDFTGTGVVLSTPAFIRARTNLEWQALVEDWDAVPTVSREFYRTERLILRFEAYAPGASTPRVEAALLNRGGDTMYPLVVQPAQDGRPYQVDIQPTGLPPGEYVVELKATIPDDETTQLVAFRLGS